MSTTDDVTSSAVRPVAAPVVRGQRQAVVGLSVFATTLFVFPSDVVLKVVGAQGFAAGLVALVLVAGWVSWVLLGGHDPRATRNPTRGALTALVAVSLVCWALTPFHGLTSAEQLSADRWMMLMATTAGVVLVASEGLTTVDALLSVLRTAVYGAAFCAFVAVLQWLFTFDLSTYLRQALPGFSLSADFTVYTSRGALQRVSGTAIHPIELGVVSAMALPIAVALALVDREHGVLRRWFPAVLIALAIPASVSRSAVLAVVASVGVFVVLLPRGQRWIAAVCAPVAAFVLVLARPGYLTTLSGLVGLGSSDSSVATRLEDYPFVLARLAEHPWFGSGGGSFLAANAIQILDNQFLKSLIEMGVVGTVVVSAYFLVPVAAALGARRRTADPRLRLVAAALAGACTAGALASLTFDSLSFNMFAGFHALVVGCVGASWLLGSNGSPHQAASDPTPRES